MRFRNRVPVVDLRVLTAFLGTVGSLLFLHAPAYGETDFYHLSATRDKGELNRTIDSAEKALQKNGKDLDSLKAIGIAYHNLGTLGDADAPGKAIEYLDKLVKLYPDDALALAVLGSSTTMIGHLTGNKATDGRIYANKGGAMIDKAIKNSPDDILARMVRANNAASLPPMFGRIHYFKDDLLHIEMVAAKTPGVPKDFMAEVYYKLGTAFDTDKDSIKAKAYYKKSADAAPDSEWGKKARKAL